MDLKDHRPHGIKALGKAGIFVDPMEELDCSEEPKHISQDRLKGCDF
jgi:hypothetical protein